MRKRHLAFAAALLVGLAACTAQTNTPAPSSSVQLDTTPLTVTAEPDGPFPPGITASTPPTAGTVAMAQVPVVSVYDGDTFRVMWEGQSTQVRVLGINAPELRPAECWGPQSADAAKTLLHPGDTVTLIADPMQGDRDRYNRLLRIVLLDGDVDLASVLLLNGDAKVYQQYPMSKTAQYNRDADDAANHYGGNGGWASPPKGCGWTR